MKLIKTPVPPMFEQAIGYEGKCRYVGFYWSHDDLVYEDGLVIMLGAHTPAWNIITTHRLMAFYSAALNFGSPYHEAVHWLVLDRHMRHFYAAPTQEARALLFNQHSGNGQQYRFNLDDVLDSIDQSIERPEVEYGQKYEREKEEQGNCRRAATYDLSRWLEDTSNPARSILRLVRSTKRS
ncbi:MAG: hypothetical protein ACYC9J_11605 [Sulfuricaulis sp.]